MNSKQPVPPSEVEGGSGAMFDTIADRYDLLNRMISFGVDSGWRRATAKSLAPRVGSRILDLAAGTGDLTIAVASAFPESEVIGLDPSSGMLEIARKKLQRMGLDSRVSLKLGIAEQLPFDDASFGAVSIGFGIRNVSARAAALREMWRVLEPGGQVAILELTDPDSGVLSTLAQFHVHRIVPTIGAMLSGRGAYRYLSKSIAKFPSALDFAQTIREAEFEVLEVRSLTFGVAHLFVARK